MNSAREYRTDQRIKAQTFAYGELPAAPSEKIVVAPPPDTIGRLGEALRRRKGLVAVIFLAAVGLTGAYVAMMPKEFSAEMRLYITRSRVDAPVSAGERAPQSPATSELSEADVNFELELLKSNDLMEQAARASGVLAATGPESGPVGTAMALKKIQKDLEVTLVKKTNIISVKYLATNPLAAQKFVNTLGDLYLEKHSTMHRNRESSQFFADKASEYKTQLENSQREMSSFEQRNGVELIDAQREQNLRRRAELRASLNETESELRQAEDRTKILNSQLQSLPATVNSQNHTARSESLIERLKLMQVDLENKRTELLTKFDPSYRLVQEVEQQLRDTKAALERETAPGVVDTVSALNPLRQSVEAELLKNETLIAGLRAKRLSVANDLLHENGEEASLARSAPMYEDLKRKTKIAEENYLLYRHKQEDSRIAEEMDQQRILNVSVLQPAAVPVLPAERHRSFLLLMGLFAGVLLSVVVALVVDQMDETLETPMQAAAAAGVPVLANFARGVQKCS